ncbi:unnamed protein product [Sphagnum balticum]
MSGGRERRTVGRSNHAELYQGRSTKSKKSRWKEKSVRKQELGRRVAFCGAAFCRDCHGHGFVNELLSRSLHDDTAGV